MLKPDLESTVTKKNGEKWHVTTNLLKRDSSHKTVVNNFHSWILGVILKKVGPVTFLVRWLDMEMSHRLHEVFKRQANISEIADTNTVIIIHQLSRRITRTSFKIIIPVQVFLITLQVTGNSLNIVVEISFYKGLEECSNNILVMIDFGVHFRFVN